MDPDKLSELLTQKQFAQLRNNPRVLPSRTNPVYLSEILQTQLVLHPNQQFVRAYLSPHSKVHRLLAYHDPGSGKTNLAIATALEHAHAYRQIHLHTGSSPSIWFIGFSRSVFLRELLRRPEFGFISRTELAELDKLRKSNSEYLQEYESKLRRRLTRKQNGGFFRFFGYKEFYNRLFLGTAETELDEDGILAGIKAGSIKVNLDLIDSMRNGFVVCDEIHNAYNSTEVNNYGLALRMLVNFFDIPDLLAESITISPERLEQYRSGTIYLLLMTGTIVNNGPAEAVDLMNILVPTSRIMHFAKSWGWKFTDIPKIKREWLFANRRDPLPGALDKIGQLVTGLVSRYQDYNPDYYPRLIIEGETIPIPKSLYHTRVSFYQDKVLPYLKFIRCPMTGIHLQTYKKQDSLPPDGQALLDMCVPDPGNPKVGLFRTREIKAAYANQKSGDLYLEDGTLDGSALRLPQLAKISTKYAAMMRDIIENLKSDGGKIFISHQNVHGSGALFIRNVLRANGILDDTAAPYDGTLCSRCGKVMKDKHAHEFEPARFVVAHGEMEVSAIEQAWNKYRNLDNDRGYKFRILVGSRKMNESVDLNAVRVEMIMHVPDDIPVLIQIIGRARRRKSHIRLPEEDREVRIRIYTSSLDDPNQLSYEENRYHEKLQDYLVDQLIERKFNENAVDAPIQRPTIFPDESLAKKQPASLGALYYQPASYLHKLDGWMAKLKNLEQLHQANYAYYAKEELALQIHLIKRMFVEQSPALSYSELWDLVRNPPFQVPVNTKLLDEGIFRVALHQLSSAPPTLMSGIDAYDPSRFFNPLDYEIMVNGIPHRLIVRDLLIIVPVTETQITEHGELGKPVSQLRKVANLALDQWYRRDMSKSGFMGLDISETLQASQYNYPQMRNKFAQQFSHTPVNQLMVTSEGYDINFHTRFIQEAIAYVFGILTEPSRAQSELHDLYFKMLYFYDKLELVIFANHLADTEYYSLYKPYIAEGELELPNFNARENAWIREGSRYNPFLMTSIAKASPKFHLDRLQKYLDNKQIKKTYAYMLPVGHFLGGSAMLYQPDSWVPAVIRFESDHQVENDKLIGYYELPANSLEVRFKIRAPIQKIAKSKDTRTVETGSACTTHKKEEILKIMSDLGIKPDGTKARVLCDQIKLYLMEMDMKAHREYRHLSKADQAKHPRVRWFYLHFERQPEIRTK